MANVAWTALLHTRMRMIRSLLTLPLLLSGLGGCGTNKETAIQDAEVGDLLVVAEGTQIELAKKFQPGVPNGLYKGAIRIVRDDDKNNSRLHAVSAVCSLEGEPNWPSYDNLYGNPIDEPAQADDPSVEDRWQILYYFAGNIETSGIVAAEPWQERLKNNLCRRGEFNDSTAKTGNLEKNP